MPTVISTRRTCICLEPDSRSRTCGVTKEAATNAKGIRITMEANTEMNAEICSCSVSVFGRQCAAAAMEPTYGEKRPPSYSASLAERPR
jgi:hypothetical protein